MLGVSWYQSLDPLPGFIFGLLDAGLDRIKMELVDSVQVLLLQLQTPNLAKGHNPCQSIVPLLTLGGEGVQFRLGRVDIDLDGSVVLS